MSVQLWDTEFFESAKLLQLSHFLLFFLLTATLNYTITQYYDAQSCIRETGEWKGGRNDLVYNSAIVMDWPSLSVPFTDAVTYSCALRRAYADRRREDHRPGIVARR